MQRIARDIQLVKQNMAWLARIEIDRKRCLARSWEAGEICARLGVKTGRFDLTALRTTRIKRFHAVEFDNRMGRRIYKVELRAFGQDCHFVTSSMIKKIPHHCGVAGERSPDSLARLPP